MVLAALFGTVLSIALSYTDDAPYVLWSLAWLPLIPFLFHHHPPHHPKQWERHFKTPKVHIGHDNAIHANLASPVSHMYPLPFCVVDGAYFPRYVSPSHCNCRSMDVNDGDHHGCTSVAGCHGRRSCASKTGKKE